MNDFRELAKEKAREVFEQYNLSVPVDLLKLTQNLNISVSEVAFERIDGLKNCDGCIFYKENAIFVDVELSPTRLKFTLAHELGHYLLRHQTQEGMYADKKASYRGKDKNNEERAADIFAAELLMPEHEMRKLHSEYVYPTLEIFVKHFLVSVEAMRIRLKEFNLEVYRVK